MLPQGFDGITDDLPDSSPAEPPADHPEPPPPELLPLPESIDASEQREGGILVHVRTARGGRGVPGAVVLITQESAGMPVLVSVQITDSSGDTPELRVPAPRSTADQQYPAYARYDIAVHADGYYRENSADVPVFEGVVSVQSFDLIPLPAGQDDPWLGAQTFYNNMPRP